MREEMEKNGIDWGELKRITNDRVKWKKSARRADTSVTPRVTRIVLVN